MCREGSILFSVAPFQADGVGDVIEFLTTDFVQLLATGCELFIDLDSFFRHGVVRFLCATNEGKIGAGSHTFVSVGIQADSNNNCRLFHFGLMGHNPKLACQLLPSKWKNQRRFIHRLEQNPIIFLSG